MKKPSASKLRWAFISNMFPSNLDVTYGVFVQRSYEDLIAMGFRIDTVIVIRGRRSGFGCFSAYATHYARLARLIIRSDLNHYYIHYASHHCLLPALAARLLGKNIVVNIHGDDLALAKSSIYRRVMAIGQTMLMRTSRLVVVPSLYFKQMLLLEHPTINPGRVVVSPSSGINFLTLKDATKNRQCYWALNPGERVAEIGYIGRIDPEKGWESLLCAFLALPTKMRSDSRLHFWGKGDDATHLCERISAHPENNIIYHGPIPPSEIPSAHASIDFHVVPSMRESLGLSAIEGLAAGHVLICNAIRPFTDITQNYVSALHYGGATGLDLVNVLFMALTMSNNTLRELAKKGQMVAEAYDRCAVASKLARDIDTYL